MKAHPYSIKIFMLEASPDGLRIISKDHWSGHLVVCPRSEFLSLKTREECQGAGIYLLIGQTGAEFPKVYIGESDELLPRLENHYANKDFWNEVIAVSSESQGLNKAYIQHLEARLVEIASRAKRCDLDNGNAPRVPSLSEADKAAAESFLDELLQIFPLIGLSIFQPAKNNPNGVVKLFLAGKGVKATGFDGPNGFTVLKGSQAVLDVVPSLSKNIVGVREDLEKKGILIKERGDYRFSEDYRFSSSSFASDLILGHPSSGPTTWKNAEGKTLKDLQLNVVKGEETTDEPETGRAHTETVRKRFWTELLKKASKITSLHARISPSRYSWVGVSFRCFYLSYLIRKHRSLIHLWIDAKDFGENKRIFEFLKGSQKEIESVFGTKLNWIQLERAFKIEKEYPNGGYAEESKWPQIQDRMIDGMIKLDKATRPYIDKFGL